MPTDASTYDTFGLYLNDIGSTALLTKDDEVRLGRLVVAGRAAKERLEGAEHLSPAEARQLRRVVRAGDVAADQFVRANLRLVVSIAKRYGWANVPVSDLVQDGNIGLMHAVELFDPEKGFKFSTYATNWIKQSISRAIANTSRTVRLPVHASDLYRHVCEARARLLGELGRKATIAEIAEACASSPDMVADVLRFGESPQSLDAPLTSDSEFSLSDRVADDTELMPEAEAIAAVQVGEVAGMLRHLDERERKILALRFGLGGDDEQTLEQVGVSFNLTRERIRQIEQRALSKLRHPTSGMHELTLV